MAMRCPNCSNEISLEETFCGQCGTPVVVSAKPVDSTQHQGLLSSGYYSGSSPASDTFRTGKIPPTNSQPSMMPPGSQQQYGFHQDPTEAMSVLPSQQVQGYPSQYARQNPGNSAIANGYPGTDQYAPQMQPFQSGNYTATIYPTTQTPANGQG